MKKKLVSLLSLILAAVMVFPVGVFADETEGNGGAQSQSVEEPGDDLGDETGGDETAAPVDPDFVIECDKEAIFDSGTKTTAKLSVPKADGVTPTKVIWVVADESIFTVDAEGKLTALKAGTATVAAFVSYKDGEETKTKTISAPVTITKNDIESIDYDDKKTITQYIVKQKIAKSDLCIIATYADGSTAEITEYTYKPVEELKTSDKKITVELNGVADLEIPIAVADINIKDLVEKIEITAPTDNKEYEVGTKIYKDDITIKLTYVGGSTSTITASDKDVTISGEGVDFSKGYHTISNDDVTAKTRTIKIEYAGLEDTVTIKAKKAGSSDSEPGSSAVTYLIEMTDAPTKKSYRIGEKFEDAGMKVKVTKRTTSSETGNSSEVNYTSKVSNLTYNIYTIKDTDAGKDYIEFEVSFNADGGTHKATLKVTGLTIGNVVDTSRIAEITSVTLKEDKYPEGYEFTFADIEKMKVRFYGERTATTIEDDEFADYEYISSKYMTLEVYDDEGERKTYSTYRDTIRDDDIITEANGDKVVNMALRYTYFSSSSSTAKGKEGEYTFKTEIGEADVSYYFDSKLIAEYDDLDDALEFCNEQDEDIDEDVFDISDVDDNDYILLKLGKSFILSSSFDFTPENNIVIDLNGYNLTLDSDAFEFDKDEDFTITIRNTSSTDSKLTYDDKDIEIVLKEDEKVEFEYDKELPGLYTVTAEFNSDEGNVTADPKLSTGKVEVGKGSTVKFTITPKADYAVDTVKVGTKSVVGEKDNYSLNSTTGVVTYTLKDVSKDTTFSVTFKKVKKEWQNPFRDVSESSDYYTAVEFVYENELFKGTTNTTFSPSGSMTRATFVTVLGRLSGMDDDEAVRKYGYDSDFTDVSASNSRITYAVPYIKWAVENGIVEGYGDGTFGPEREITHQQMYVMMYRYARFVENKSDSIQYTSLSMSDRNSVADWAVDAVKYAQKNDYLVYTNSTQTKIDPAGAAKRSELAMLLEDFCETVLGWSGDAR